MATKVASFGGPLPHTSGLFADMTVDGPEIGTLVLVVDRAKNLPNRKTMGKQNPYCAARLGKEARKTETDKRGGQTPRWDQELRFTVHDSPDYHKLKISAFSEDKRTELIGEAWVDLTKVVIPGGGKDDLWQGLNYKGKYAGELRIELTYYDSRPKPDLPAESVVGVEELRQSAGSGSGRVKRRPLPSNPNSGHVTPDMIPGPAIPGRARHGPRDFRTPPRANSMPPETTMQTLQQVPHAYNSSPVGPMHQTPPNQYYGEYDAYDEPVYGDEGNDVPLQPDFLPQLPPSNRQRERQPRPQQFGATRPHQAPAAHPHSLMILPHSYSAPSVPQTQHAPAEFDDGSQLSLEYPDPIPDLEYQHQQLTARRRNSSISPGYQAGYEDPYATHAPTSHGDLAPPPPPPVHSNSAPVVPHYGQAHGRQMSSSPFAIGQTPPHNRHHSVPNAAPQNIGRGYGSPQQMPHRGHPTRGSSVDEYASSPEHLPYNSSPSAYTPGQTIRPTPLRPSPHRNSVADPYQVTPPRPHPLSQEVPRPRSPLPPLPHQSAGPSPPQQATYSSFQHDHRGRDAVPLIKPRALSPQPPPPPAQSSSAPRPRSSYSIQHPVRAFESADESPLSTSQVPLQTSQRSTPARKSVSSNPGTPTSAPGGVPYSPDDFNVHNPNASHPTLPEGTSPHSPYQVLPGTVTALRNSTSGPIVGWHGQEIDPSDHLPVDSWAPEPEKKVPSRTYGLGRDRDFGPRSAQDGSRNVSKDTVVNFRMKAHSQPQSPAPAPVAEPESPTRNRLQKKCAQGKGSAVEPLRERHNFNSVSVPNPYAQQEYSAGFYGGGEYGSNNGYGVEPSLPSDRLAREISSIDIGSGAGRGGGGGRSGFVPSPTAYVPVRSHRDRNTFY